VPTATPLTLSRAARVELEALARSNRGRADEARRARIILLLTDGHSYSTICERIDCTPQTIATWKARYEADGITGLRGRHRGSKRRVLTPQVEARILSWTRKPPTDGTTHWSTRRLGDRLGVPHTVVQRAWKRAGLQPHRLERYLRSTDPNFEDKAAEIIGLYLDPRSTRRSFASMKRPPFRRSTAAIPSCRCRPAALSGTASSTFVMGRSRSTPPWRPRRAP
jgi:transposase